ncbi:MAG: hypothetical protein ACOYLB_02795 [Phototrophicaceae bacterium]
MSILKDPTVRIVAGYFPKFTTLALAVISFALGMVWAYVISPTTFVDGDPVQLAQPWQDEWVRGLEARYVNRNAQIDAYILELLAKVDNPEEIMLRTGLNADPEFTQLVQQAQVNAGTPPNRPTITSNYVIPIVVTLVFALIFAILKALWSLLIYPFIEPMIASRSKSIGDVEAAAQIKLIKERKNLEKEMNAAAASSTEVSRYGTPIIRKLSVYRAGFGNYDDSFNIETEAGLYYGEAGGSIAEKVGDGVAAIEIWMFDKDEFVNTPTAVIASSHLFNDPSTRTKLEAKGNVIVAQAGQKVILETKALYLEARIQSVDYDANAPIPNSVFTSMNIEVIAWSKASATTTPAPLPTMGSAPLPPMPTSPLRTTTGALPLQGQGVPSFPASQPMGGNMPLTPPSPFANAPMPTAPSAFSPSAPSSPTVGSRPEDLFGASSPFGKASGPPDDPFGGTGDFTPIQ